MEKGNREKYRGNERKGQKNKEIYRARDPEGKRDSDVYGHKGM